MSSVGNHEFDHGFRGSCDETRRLSSDRRVPGRPCLGGDVQLLSANVVRTSTHKPLFAPTAGGVGGVPNRFIGETLRGRPHCRAAGTRRHFRRAATANAYAAQRRQGIHAILLIHEGGRQQPRTARAARTAAVSAARSCRWSSSRRRFVVITGHARFTAPIGGHLVTSAHHATDDHAVTLNMTG